MEDDWVWQGNVQEEEPTREQIEEAAKRFDKLLSDPLPTPIPEVASVERACKDRDPPSSDSVGFSPVLSCGSRGNVEIPTYTHTQLAANSPRRLAGDNAEKLSIAVQATFRLQTQPNVVSPYFPEQHGTGAPVSPDHLASALHMLYDANKQPQVRFRAMGPTPVFASDFAMLQERRYHLADPSRLTSSIHPPRTEMLDPVTSRPYATDPEERYDDTVIFRITDLLTAFPGQVPPELPRSFPVYWLPGNAEEEAQAANDVTMGINQRPACYLVNFPCVNKLLLQLESNEDIDREEIFRTYESAIDTNKIADIVIDKYRLASRKALRDHEARGVYQLMCEKEIRTQLTHLWRGTKDGHAVVSLGRQLARNKEMVASAYSTSNGSSGAFLGLLSANWPPLLFDAIHDAPAVARKEGVKDGFAAQPDHNLATATTNASFVIKYATHALPSIHPPSHAHWSEGIPDMNINPTIQRSRKLAFGRYIVKVLPDLVLYKALIDGPGATWTESRRLWISDALQQFSTAKAFTPCNLAVSQAALHLLQMPAIFSQLQSAFDRAHVKLPTAGFGGTSLADGLRTTPFTHLFMGKMRQAYEKLDLTAWRVPADVNMSSVDAVIILAEQLAEGGVTPQLLS